MIKKKYLILTLMLSLLGTNKTFAACTQEEINAFKKIEDEFKITYKYNIDSNDYYITFYNPSPEIYSYLFDEKFSDMKYVSGTGEKLTFSGLKVGKYETTIIGISGCKDEFKKIEFELSKKNQYHEDPLCEGIEEFVLCQPTYDKEIDYETFKSRVETYKRTKEKKENIESTKKEEENEILSYIKNNIISISIIIVFIILVLITTIITAKSIEKSRRLE